MCVLGGCKAGLEGEGLVGREVLMDFRLVSQFLFTQERVGREMRQRGKTNTKHENAYTHTITHKR